MALSSLACSGAIVLGVLGVIGFANGLKVVTPDKGQVVIADRTYTVEWTGTGDNNRFEIDLFYCGSFCMEEDGCGEWVTALCPYGDDGCPDNDGDYDIVMPEPLGGASGPGYKVRVMDADDAEDADCSDEFYLMASAEAPGVGDVDGPYLIVTAPAGGDSADAGEEYTVEFDYDNGVGSRVDRFKIDLYSPGGSGGDCGAWVTNLCDKESIGCKDSMGDYDITIPEMVPSGTYSIRVGRFEDDSLFGCSDPFEIYGSSGSASGGGEGFGSDEGEGVGATSSASGSGSGSAGGSGSGSGSGSGNAGGSGSASSSASASASASGEGEGEGEAAGGGGGSGGAVGGASSSASGEGSTGGGGAVGEGEGEGGGGDGSVGGTSSSGSISGKIGGGGGGGDESGDGGSGDDGSGDSSDSDDSDDSDDSGDGDSGDGDGDSDDDFGFDLSFSYSYSYMHEW